MGHIVDPFTNAGFGRTLVLTGTHTYYLASGFSVNGTFQIVGPSKGSNTQAPPPPARAASIYGIFGGKKIGSDELRTQLRTHKKAR